MARPPKQGMDYFPHDTDLDEKVEALQLLYGKAIAYAFYFKLLERIYRRPDVELDISDAEIRQVLAERVGISLELFDKILATALKLGLFDAQAYQSRSVLTSNGIKRRAAMVFEKREAMSQRYKAMRVSAAETQQKPPVGGKARVPKVHPLFGQFWAAYPKKKSKGEAERRFAKINPDEQLLATMLTAIEQAKTSRDWQKDGGQFIPNPATWLNAKGWLDEDTPISQRHLHDRTPAGGYTRGDLS